MFKRTLLAVALAGVMGPATAAGHCDHFSDGVEQCTAWLNAVMMDAPQEIDAMGNRYWAGTDPHGPAPPNINNIPQQSGFVAGYAVKVDIMDQTIYSTLIGNGGEESILSAFAIDQVGHAYVGGRVQCSLLGANNNLGCLAFHDGQVVPWTGFEDVLLQNGYVAKIGPFGQFFVWAWNLGGSGSSHVDSVTLDIAGRTVVTGVTTAFDFPVTRAVPACGNPTGNPDLPGSVFTVVIDDSGIVESWCGGGGSAGRAQSVGFYVPDTGRFLLKDQHAGGSADYNFRFGPAPSARLPITGDWNNNGQETIGLYDQAMGQFWLSNELRRTRAHARFRYGPKGVNWTPIAGDWNGDGTTTVGLYDPVRSKFFLRNSHTPGGADVSFRFGPANFGWLPIVGDWDGDGVDTIGLYDPIVGTFYLKNTLAGGAADVAFRFGSMGSGWLPLAGDWDADGTTTVGLYDPAGSGYHLTNSHTGGAADVSFRYGPMGSGWMPVTGDWDGS